MTNSTQSPILDKMSLELLTLLESADSQVASSMAAEAMRQQYTLELIASENHVSPAVMHTMGSWPTNHVWVCFFCSLCDVIVIEDFSFSV